MGEYLLGGKIEPLSLRPWNEWNRPCVNFHSAETQKKRPTTLIGVDWGASIVGRLQQFNAHSAQIEDRWIEVERATDEPVTSISMSTHLTLISELLSIRSESFLPPWRLSVPCPNNTSPCPPPFNLYSFAARSPISYFISY